ncbi:MAG: hypothetical protein MUC92_10435 [Fimbriimonadaceae bacterium]|jgi:hypothetical protein|nr:hypothetical protein [Fimbriimonadaceae bacterium]
MNQFDWQEFESGEGSEALTQRAKEALQQEEAKAEFEGLKAFRAAVKSEGLKEMIPVMNLEKKLSDVARKGSHSQAKPLWLWIAPVAATAALAAVFFSSSLNPVSEPVPFVTTSTLASHQSINPQETALWLASNGPTPVAEIALKGVACHLNQARVGDKWVAWDFQMKDEDYTIYAKQSSDCLRKYQLVERGGRGFYVSSKGVGWRCKAGMSYYVVGGTEEGRWQIATQACQETPNLVRL